MSHFNIYQLDKTEDSDPFTSTHIWRRYFKLKSAVFRAFGEGMKNIQREIDRVVQKFENDKIVNYSHAKMERKYSVFRDWDKKISEDALSDSRLFMEIKTALDNYKDEEKDALILKNYEQNLKEAKKTFFDQVEKVDLAKEKYHKKAFKAEKEEIKIQITDKEAEIKKFTERFEELKEKVTAKLEKYREEIYKLGEAGRKLKQESCQYTGARKTVDASRALFILNNLKKCSDNAKIRPDDIEEVDVDGMRINEVLTSRVPLQKITIKKNEKYKGTKNKEELIKQMKKELEEERKRKKEEDYGKDDDIEEHLTQGDYLGFRLVAKNKDIRIDYSVNKDVGKRFLVIKAFKKQDSNQISLGQGKIVKTIMPVNDKGIGFGEKKGRFGRKQKGYFPVSHVTPAD